MLSEMRVAVLETNDDDDARILAIGGPIPSTLTILEAPNALGGDGTTTDSRRGGGGGKVKPIHRHGP